MSGVQLSQAQEAAQDVQLSQAQEAAQDVLLTCVAWTRPCLPGAWARPCLPGASGRPGSAGRVLSTEIQLPVGLGTERLA